MRYLLICIIVLFSFIPTAFARNNIVGISESSPYTFGETIHPFTDTPTYENRGPYYSLFCYQSGITVYGISQYLVFPRDGSTVAFVLSGQDWVSGAADCDLSVWHVNPGFKNRTIDGTFSFHVNG